MSAQDPAISTSTVSRSQTHSPSLSSATNLGATGSITFLFVFQMLSHSRFKKACDGPCWSMNCVIASTVMPRRRIPARDIAYSRVSQVSSSR